VRADRAIDVQQQPAEQPAAFANRPRHSLTLESDYSRRVRFRAQPPA
jgi:hypothetical protein